MMKILHFFIVLTLTLACSLNAIAFSNETANEVARRILKNDKSETIQLTSAVELHNRIDGRGCVLVGNISGEQKVLAYSNSSSIDPNNLPPEFLSFLNNFTERANNSHPMPAAVPANSSEDYHIIVNPLLSNIEWLQVEPFNSKLPQIDNQNVTVGCVGLAFAMLMNYHKWPEHGSGTLSYNWRRPDFTSQQLSVTLGHNYEWDKIRDSYWGYDERTSEEIDAVATLCRDMAYAAKTDFTTWGSGGSDYYGCRALINNFDYDQGIGYATLNTMKQADYIALLKAELLAKRPCLYRSGNTPAGSGAHAYVCDGFDSNDFFHFNFGWGGGFSDMYYSIAPDGLMGEDQGYYYGIKKNENGAPMISLGAYGDFSKEASSEINCELYFSYFGAPRKIRVGYAVENISTEEIYYYETRRTISEDEAGGVTGYFQVTIDELPTKDGEYIVYPVGGFAVGTWKKFTFGDLYQDYFCLSIKNGIKTFSNPDIVFPLEGDRVEIDKVIYLLDDANRTATITFRNRRFDHYGETVKLSPTVKYNNKEYTVTKIGERAFRSLKPAFQSITIPSTIEEIENDAFVDRNDLHELNIPSESALRRIGESAFYGCPLESVKIPSTLKEISSFAFTYNRLSKIDIPETVETLGYRAFTTFGQVSKCDVYVHWMDLTDKNINWYAFDESSTTPQYRPYRTLHIPRGMMDMYREQASPFFDEIIDDQEAGINDVSIDQTITRKELYTLQGFKVDDTNIKSGIYIVVSNGQARKVFLTEKP